MRHNISISPGKHAHLQLQPNSVRQEHTNGQAEHVTRMTDLRDLAAHALAQVAHISNTVHKRPVGSSPT